MSHFAKVLDRKVVNVIVAEPEFFNTFIDTTPGTWIQTSYNTKGNNHLEGRPLRGNFAGIGYTYDPIKDVFYEQQPYPSWTLNESTWLWESPTPYPNNGNFYYWDEATLSWIEKT